MQHFKYFSCAFLILIFLFQKSSLGESWPAPGVRLHSSISSDVSMKYVVHKQPLSLDRFFIHEVSPSEAASAKLDHAFVLVCLNRFQQIVSVLSFQADTEQLKVHLKVLVLKVPLRY
jgi:hypothetical protein